MKFFIVQIIKIRGTVYAFPSQIMARGKICYDLIYNLPSTIIFCTVMYYLGREVLRLFANTSKAMPTTAEILP